MPHSVHDLMSRVGYPLDRIAQHCHAVSLAIVRSGLYPGSRVARGTAKGVGGQHSWVVVGDAYDPDAPLIDATLWSYDPTVTGVWEGTYRDEVHRPHGWGHFLRGVAPQHHGGATVHLARDPGPAARQFLSSIGAPFDVKGWIQVASLPVQGWPAREVIEAMLDTPTLSPLVPIDIAGMLTDRNPGGLYLATEVVAATEER